MKKLKLNDLITLWWWHTNQPEHRRFTDDDAYVALLRVKAWVDEALGVLEASPPPEE